MKEVFASPKHPITKELISFLPQDEQSFITHLGDLHNVYKVIFTGPNAQSPLISQMIRKFDVDVNILSGSIDELRGGEVGHLVIKFSATELKIDNALSWLIENGVTIEHLQRFAIRCIESRKGGRKCLKSWIF